MSPADLNSIFTGCEADRPSQSGFCSSLFLTASMLLPLISRCFTAGSFNALVLLSCRTGSDLYFVVLMDLTLFAEFES